MLSLMSSGYEVLVGLPTALPPMEAKISRLEALRKTILLGLRGDVYLGAGAVSYADGGVGCELVLASCQQEVACQGYDYDKYE